MRPIVATTANLVLAPVGRCGLQNRQVLTNETVHKKPEVTLVSKNMKRSATTATSAQGTATAAPSGTDWSHFKPDASRAQKTISLPNHPRGCHVVTRSILKDLPEIQQFEVGMASFFVQHTSCSLTINENASPDVPLDLNDYLNKVAPEGRHYRHLDEGMDDMPAHLKSSLMGVSLSIPIQHGRLALGTWQGIYLNEHRDYGGTRKIIVTIQGQKRADGRKFGSSIF